MGVKAGGGPAITDAQLIELEGKLGGTAGHQAALEIRRLREELATPPDERSEIHWGRGYSAALVGMLAKVLSDLGYHDTEATRSKWIIEREGAIRALRHACRQLGDNDWPDDLSLDDIVEKHLHRHFDAGRIVGTIQRLLESLPDNEARLTVFIESICWECGAVEPCARHPDKDGDDA